MIGTLLDKHEILETEDPRKFSDYVPQEVKEEFDLRQDMTSYEVDFELVRSTDV